MGSEHYCLRWNNHQSNLLGVFSQLLEAESLVDVTLASSEGHSLRAHKVVLSACSSYFRALFLDHPARHPIVILKDVCFAELRTLVEFMYRGEVSVETCRLPALLKTAESLKVKGLAEMTAGKTNSEEGGAGKEGSNQSESRRRGDESPPPAPPSTNAAPGPDDTRTRTPPPPPPPPEPPADEPMPLLTTVDDASSEHGQPDDDASSVQSGPSDMTVPPPAHSPHSSEPLPGPSGLPPVQDAPLSLKKEVDWDRDDRSQTGESSSDYRHPHDPEVCLVEGEYAPGSSRSLDQISNSSRSSTPFQYPITGLAGALYSETVVSLLRAQGIDLPGGVRCSVCLAGFPTPWLLDQHIQLQHPGHRGSPHPAEPMRDDKPFRCDQCGQSYRYRSAYLKHREQNHRARLPADKLFTCDVCGMQFRYLKSFKKHRLNHTLERLHTGSRRPVERDKEEEETNEGQDEVTSSNEAVGRPTEPSDQDDTVDSVTAGGGESSSLIGLLRLNERQRTPRSFACPFCGKCVRSKENLKLHVRKHTGERPFACLFCGRAFGGKSDLTRHLRIHTGERPYHCEMCGKCFARADYLSKHLTTHIHQSQHR